ncbi:Histidine protein kinase NIK1 [Penicillium rolfsii]|nr:Histidine protein kinase NIK1 [Penicillium rolfsii]
MKWVQRRPLSFICYRKWVVALRVDELDSHHLEVERIPTLGFDAILFPSLEFGLKLRANDRLSFVPLVLMTSGLSLPLKAAAAIGITSCITIPCRHIDLWNGILPALGNRRVHASSGSTPPLSILLAEDNDINITLAVRILGKYKHVVSVVGDGLQALEAAKRRRYDVILTDVQMPVMGGFEATTKIMQWEEVRKLPRTPIIAITAHAMLGDQEQCLVAGMDDYVSKPLNQSLLIETIAKFSATRISASSPPPGCK